MDRHCDPRGDQSLSRGCPLFHSPAIQETNSQLQITEQGQITDRYNAAITNLGSRSIDIRLGGIYALQRLMQDSPRDQPTVVSVLCAFVRDQTSAAYKSKKPPSAPPGTDIEAALTVVGTRNPKNDGRRTVIDLESVELAGAQLSLLQLSGANLTFAELGGATLSHANLARAGLFAARLSGAQLRGAHLAGAHLSQADLSEAFLTGAFLSGAHLEFANLNSAYLPGADLSHAHLFGAHLSQADLEVVNLSHADLSGAHLHMTVLRRADLTGAHLTGAHLTGAYLSRADLTGADLTGAIWPTVFPPPMGWFRDPSSGRLRGAK